MKNKKGSSSNLEGDDDDKPQCWMDSVTDEMINEALSKNNMVVPGWGESAPSYASAAWDVPVFAIESSMSAIFFIRWHLFYTLLKFDCSDSDREEMCRRHFKKTFEELSKKKNNSYFNELKSISC